MSTPSKGTWLLATTVSAPTLSTGYLPFSAAQQWPELANSSSVLYCCPRWASVRWQTISSSGRCQGRTQRSSWLADDAILSRWKCTYSCVSFTYAWKDTPIVTLANCKVLCICKRLVLCLLYVIVVTVQLNVFFVFRRCHFQTFFGSQLWTVAQKPDVARC